MSTAPQTTPPRLLTLVGAALAALFAFPTIYLVQRNFSGDSDSAGSASDTGLIELLTSERTLAPLWRTVKLAVTVSLTAALVGTALAWLTTRTDIPLRRLWRTILPLPLVFPTFIGAAAFIRTLNPGGLASGLFTSVGFDQAPELRGFFGAWLVLSLFTYPYVYLPVAARLQRLPGSLEESARVLGDSAAEAFRRIVIPQIASAVAAGTLLVFLYTISDFGAVQLMRYDTLTRAIETNYLGRASLAFALSLFLLALAVVIVGFERALQRRTHTATSARSTQSVGYSLGRWRVPGAAFVVAVGALSVGAPMIALIDWASDGLLRASRNGRPLTIDSEAVMSAAQNTLESSVLAALAAVAAVLPIAFLVGRYKSRVGSLSHSVVIATFALPGILIALSLRYWVLKSGIASDFFTDSKLVLIFAYVVRFGSLAMGITLVAVQAVPERFHDVGATLGARRLRRLRTIDLPLMAPGLLAAIGLVLLSTMKELPISLIIAPIGYRTLTTRIFGSFEDAFVAETGIMAVVLVAMSAVLTWLLVLRRAEHQ